jgi:hypothetical protein
MTTERRPTVALEGRIQVVVDGKPFALYDPEEFFSLAFEDAAAMSVPGTLLVMRRKDGGEAVAWWPLAEVGIPDAK